MEGKAFDFFSELDKKEVEKIKSKSKYVEIQKRYFA